MGAQSEPLSPDEAAVRVGEVVRVRGHVSRVVCSAQACLLSFDAGFGGLAVRIDGDSLDRFPLDVRGEYEGRTIEFEGRVSEERGRPRISVSEPSGIRVPKARRGLATQKNRAPDTTSPPQTAAARTAATGAALRQIIATLGAEADADGAAGRDQAAAPHPDHLPLEEAAAPRELDTEPLLRAYAAEIEFLHERVGQLEARIAALEGAAAPPPELEPLPSNVFGERAGVGTRSVKRGWTARQVRKLIGDPLEILPLERGESLWNYGEGRSITMTRRGRVSTMAGF